MIPKFVQNVFRPGYWAVLLIALFSTGCTEQVNEHTQGVLEQVFSKSKIHSDFLKYAYSNGGYDGTDENIIAESFIDNHPSFSSFSLEEKRIIKEVVSIHSNPPTKGTEKAQPEIDRVKQMSEEILSYLSSINNVSLISQAAMSLLEKEEYTSLPAESYAILCITAATYADSIQYWEEYIDDIIDIPQTKSRFWDYVKRYAIADAEEGLASACVSALFGPLCLEAIFVSAGVGSMIVCGKDIINMI